MTDFRLKRISGLLTDHVGRWVRKIVKFLEMNVLIGNIFIK